MQKLLLITLLYITSLYSAAHNPKDLFWAVAKGDFFVTAAVLNRYPDWLNIKNELGQTPLCVAIINLRATILRDLIRRGANVHVLDNEKKSLLYHAFQPFFLNREYCKALLEHGHTPFYCSPGMPPIVLAAKKGLEDVVQMLLTKGAYVDERDKNGITPLEAAAIHNHVTVVKLLLEHGADINAHSTAGNSPIHWGRYWQNRNKPKLLKVLTQTKRKIECILPCPPVLYLQNREFGERNRSRRTPVDLEKTGAEK